MASDRWTPPVELSAQELFVTSRLKRTGKLFVFLRLHRHELFDPAFQAELEGMYADAPHGTAAKPPATGATCPETGRASCTSRASPCCPNRGAEQPSASARLTSSSTSPGAP
jgi:hypothetical protein